MSFLVLLCLFFRVSAQENTRNKSGHISNMGNKGIGTGQAVPDVFVTGVSGLVLDGRAVSSFHLSALRGRLVILDFWATWCAPCRAMVPVMDSLQRVFGDRVLFLPVAYQAAEVVAPVLAQLQQVRPFHLPGVTGDKILGGLFPHHSLPHYVWIDSSGVVAAITEEKEVNAVNIRALLDGGGVVMPEKRDSLVVYDKQRPLLVDGNGGNSAALIYHSILTGYMPGLVPGMDISASDGIRGQRFNLRNIPLTWLCRMAYSDDNRWFPDARIRLLSADSAGMHTRLSGQAFLDWLAAGNGWCYELQVPPALAGSAYAIMQEDLRRLFPQYAVRVERAKVRCLALVRTSGEDKLRSAGSAARVEIGPFACELHNSTLSQLIKRLEVQYMQDSRLPVIDDTGYGGRVDLSLHAPLYKPDALNLELAKYDLQFVEKEAVVELLMVRDNPVIK